MSPPGSSFKTVVRFLVPALLAAAPWLAQAQNFATTNDTIVLASTAASYRTISGNMDNAAPITFNVTIAYTAGDPAWMSFSGNACAANHSGTYITPVFVSFGVGCFAGQLSANVNHVATVTLTATAPAGAAGATEIITVYYYSGTGGTQTLNPSTSTVGIGAAVGGTGFGSFSLSTTSAAPVSYSITENPAVPWLTFTQNQSATVTTGNPVTVGLQANAGAMGAGPYSTSLQISYNGTTLNVGVNFTVGVGSGTLAFGQSIFNFAYTNGGPLPSQQSTSITNSTANTYTFSVNASPNTWLAVNGQILSNGAVSGATLIGTPINLQLDGNTTQLGTGSYTAIVTITDSNNNTGTLTVYLSVNGGSSSGPVGPTSVSFHYQTGQTATSGQLQQYLTIGGVGAFSIAAPTENTSPSVPWLLAAGQASGSAPALVTIGVNPTVSGGLGPGTYTGSYTVTTTYSGVSTPQTVNVTLTVSSGTAQLVANPGIVNLNCNSCSSIPAAFVQITATDSSNLPIAVTGASTGNWLSAAVSSVGSTTPTSVQLTFNNPASLANGLYTGTVTVTSGALTVAVPVELLVTGSSTSGGGNLILGASALTFNAQLNGAAPPSQTLPVTASAVTSFTASVSPFNGGNWLSISPSGNLNTNQNLMVTANPNGLGIGTYSGAIYLLSGGITQTINVTLAVGATAGTFTVSPSPVTLSTLAGGAATQASVTVTSPISGTLSASVTGSGLSIAYGASQYVTAGIATTVVVLGNPSNLPAGTYSGSLLLQVNGTAISQSYAVAFTVGAPAGYGILSSLSPNSAAAGGLGFTLTVTGSGFLAGSTVDWNGTALSTTYGGATQLTAVVPSSLLVYPGTVAVTVSSLSGTASNYLIFTINSSTPYISSLNPNAANVGGYAFTLTVNGSGFLSGATVFWNAGSLSTTYVSGSQLTAAVSAAIITVQGTATVKVVNPNAATSNSVTFTIGSMSLGISGLSPSSATAGGPKFTMTVNGTGFLSGSTVLWNGSALTTTYVSATQETAVVNAGLLQSQGAVTVTVVNPGGATSNAVTLTITAAAPGISALSPNSATAGGPAFVLTVNGAGYLPSSTVLWNGSALTTSYVSATQLTASVTATQIVSQGTVNVSVSNFGAASNTLPFTINAPSPIISSLSPNTATTGGTAFTLTVNGSGFLTSSSVYWNGSALSTSYVGASELTAAVPAAQLASPGTVNVTVTNSTGGTSTAASFAVTPPSPAITSLGPNSNAAGGPAFTLAVNGAGFLSGSTVYWNNSALSTTYQSGTELQAAVPASLIFMQGTATVNVVNPSGATSNTVTFTITPGAALSIVTTSPLPAGTVGTPYSQAFTATGGTTPYKGWTVVGGTLPTGMSLSTISGLLTGLLNGVPSAPGTFTFTLQVTDNAGVTATRQFTVTINGGPVSISAAGIVNAASYVGGSVSPGEIITIFGSGLGPATLVGLQLDSRGYVSNSLAGTQVLFDGLAAPLIYTQAAQVSVVVPYEVYGRGTTQVQVVYQGQSSGLVPMTVTSVTPGIFAFDSSGHGPGAIVNQDGTINSSRNAAAAGAYVFVYATGGGQTNPGGVDGQPGPNPAPLPLARPITATIGGVPAEVQYAGGVTGLVAGVLQVNLQVPPGVSSGANPVVITMAGQSTQANLTVAVK